MAQGLHGKETHFLTGTDEHGQKVFDAAKRLNKTPQQHVDAMVEPLRLFGKRWTLSSMTSFVQRKSTTHICCKSRFNASL